MFLEVAPLRSRVLSFSIAGSLAALLSVAIFAVETFRCRPRAHLLSLPLATPLACVGVTADFGILRFHTWSGHVFPIECDCVRIRYDTLGTLDTIPCVDCVSATVAKLSTAAALAPDIRQMATQHMKASRSRRDHIEVTSRSHRGLVNIWISAPRETSSISLIH